MSGVANTQFFGSFGGLGAAEPIWLGQPGELDVTPGNDFTVMLGMRVQGLQSRIIWSNNNGGANEGWRINISASAVTAAGVRFTVGDDGGSDIDATAVDIPATHNGVHLIICQYEAGNEIRLYVDGLLRDSTALPGAYIPSTSVAELGDGAFFVKVNEAAFSTGLLDETQIGNYFSDFLRTGLLRPGTLLYPKLAGVGVPLADLDSVYSITRSQRTAPVQAFPSLGTGPQVTLNAALPGPYPLNTHVYDTVPVVV